MSIATRQSLLFSGDNWQALYAAFTSINFNAADPASINAALQQYIRANYADSFNDWIASSEFVAVIDLLAWLAGNLAFKTDVSMRENGIDTAEARSSILRLARFLSYNDTRNQPATGVLKVVAISTSDDVPDSFGRNLANTTILWNDPNNDDWYDQFVAVLNNALVGTNPFGLPIKSGALGTLAGQVYRLNAYTQQNDLSFAATIGGSDMRFEVCDADFDDGIVFERAPDPQGAFHFYNISDGQGAASPNTGFFLLFKQGRMLKQLFPVLVPVENMLLDITSTGVTQDDVWVHTLANDGSIATEWTRVPAVLSSNITYNALPASQRYIFSVVSRDNDAVSIRFSDGRFGNAPLGAIQVTYRTANGLAYTIRPQEMSQITTSFSFYNPAGAIRSLTLTSDLQAPVTNAAAAETVDEIRAAMTGVFATQNRMVSGTDYNTFPLSTNLATRIKALNRVTSGHARTVPLSDPTGTYQDLTVFADDGIYFNEAFLTERVVPSALGQTPSEFVEANIQPMLNAPSVLVAMRRLYSTMIPTSAGKLTALPGLGLSSTDSLFLRAGSGAFANTATLFGTIGPTQAGFFQPGAMVAFQSPAGGLYWAGVVSVSGLTLSLSRAVPAASVAMGFLPAYRPVLDAVTVALIETSYIALRQGFTLSYDFAASGLAWSVGPPVALSLDRFSPFDPAGHLYTSTAVPVMTVDYAPPSYAITVLGSRSVFESRQSVQWYDQGRRGSLASTGDLSGDSVGIMRFYNAELEDAAGSSGYGLSMGRVYDTLHGGDIGPTYDLSVGEPYVYANGAAEPRRTVVTLADSRKAGFPDNPLMDRALLSDVGYNSVLFWRVSDYPSVVPAYDVWITHHMMFLAQVASVPDATVLFVLANSEYGVYDPAFHVYDAATQTWSEITDGSYSYAFGRGANVASFSPESAASQAESGISLLLPAQDLVFRWTHLASSDHRIDPSQSNLHDIYVLGFAYDAAIRLWLANGALPATLPYPPTEFDLRVGFSGMEEFRMFSDGIVWRPVRYKLLFGAAADASLQASIAVVRVANPAITDGMIKNKVVAAINAFFAAANWDFGQSFYWTELAAYLHVQLAGLIGSVVPVPLDAASQFGAGFEVACDADEMFLSCAQVSDVEIIVANTASVLRIR